MIPEDKFGNVIYTSTFMKLKENEKVLVSIGYYESKNKPNLFYKRIAQGWLYADMRGTEIVKMWADTRPLFYSQFNSEIPKWERRRLIKIELSALFFAECPCRLSFFFPSNSEEFENTSAYIDSEIGVYDWAEGYCQFCNKDFQDEGEFCSKTCEEKYLDKLKTSCKVCGQKINFDKEIQHHITYFPEEIITIHASCHNRIHKSDKYPHLKPNESEIREYYFKKTGFKPTEKYRSRKEKKESEALTRIQLIKEGQLSSEDYCYICGNDFQKDKSFTFHDKNNIHTKCYWKMFS